MKKIQIFFLSLLSCVLILSSCNNSGSSSQREKSPEELRMELKYLENSSPTNYLSAKGTYSKNFWDDKFKLSCTITNNATIATFKDVKTIGLDVIGAVPVN